MKSLAKLIGLILGILGLSAKATAAKKAKATVQKRKASVQTKKIAVKKAQKKKPVKKPNITSAKKARASLKSRAKR